MYLRAKCRWIKPRLAQLWQMYLCAMDPRHHAWGRWRIETEGWFEYVEEPEPWAWRTCRRCGLMEHIKP